jgi:hypothetical protein
MRRELLDWRAHLVLGTGRLHKGHVGAGGYGLLEAPDAFLECFVRRLVAAKGLGVAGVGARNDDKVSVGAGLDCAADALEVDLARVMSN